MSVQSFPQDVDRRGSRLAVLGRVSLDFRKASGSSHVKSIKRLACLNLTIGKVALSKGTSESIVINRGIEFIIHHSNRLEM